MSEPLVERPEPKTSEPFSEMARAIIHNAGQGFGGAVVIVPPAGGGEPIELLLLDSSADVSQFFATVQSRISIRLQNLDDKQRIAGGLGLR